MNSKLPKKLPSSQSVFYMKLITYSYFRANNLFSGEKNNELPLNVQNSLNVLRMLNHVSDDIHKALGDSLTLYLLENNGEKLKKLTEFYKKDKLPRNFGKINNIGYIPCLTESSKF